MPVSPLKLVPVFLGVAGALWSGQLIAMCSQHHDGAATASSGEEQNFAQSATSWALAPVADSRVLGRSISTCPLP
jgi:hypothetical protein